MEYLRRTNYDHVVCKDLGPSLLSPEVTAHFSTEMSDLLVKITFKDSRLLKYERNAVNLDGD